MDDTQNPRPGVTAVTDVTFGDGRFAIRMQPDGGVLLRDRGRVVDPVHPEILRALALELSDAHNRIQAMVSPAIVDACNGYPTAYACGAVLGAFEYGPAPDLADILSAASVGDIVVEFGPDGYAWVARKTCDDTNPARALKRLDAAEIAQAEEAFQRLPEPGTAP